jgi:hypothetical protein
MFRLEGRVTDVKLNPKITILDFGETHQESGVYLFVANSDRETGFSIPIEISQNPIEERRLKRELKGAKVDYERENIMLNEPTKYSQDRLRLTIKSGKFKGVILSYYGNPIGD